MKSGLAVIGMVLLSTPCVAEDSAVEPISHRAEIMKNSEWYKAKANSIETIGETARWRAAGARWTGAVYCPYGTFANGFQIKLEGQQGSGDDTAMNGLWLVCKGATGGAEHVIQSGMGDWGKPVEPTQKCPAGEFLFSYELREEPHRGPNHDDTSANGLRFGCRPYGSDQEIPSGTPLSQPGFWGDWRPRSKCGGKSLIVGVETLIEPAKSDNDDTAMNDVRFFCMAPL
ncbi:hypothetical protein [Pseudomonas kermanshahensis]|uniref:hypothetical protein n=1 Tax=Pseudomonas kermanshahensis TaxID=2745482 RepID=UPI003B8A9406